MFEGVGMQTQSVRINCVRSVLLYSLIQYLLTVLVCSTLLETVFSVLDNLCTQDSPIFPVTAGGKMGPYIDQ